MFGQVFGRAKIVEVKPPVQGERIRRQLEKKRYVQKITFSPSWKYLRERLFDSRRCEPGQFRTMTLSSEDAKDVKGVLCCLRKTEMRENQRGCFDIKTGQRVDRLYLQAMLHNAEKYRARHPKVFARLMAAPMQDYTSRGFTYKAHILESKQIPTTKSISPVIG